MITISELQSILTRVQQSVGDVEVKLKHVETEAYTEAKDILIALSIDASASPSSVTISHGEPTATTDTPATAAAEAAGATGDVIAAAQ